MNILKLLKNIMNSSKNDEIQANKMCLGIDSIEGDKTKKDNTQLSFKELNGRKYMISFSNLCKQLYNNYDIKESIMFGAILENIINTSLKEKIRYKTRKSFIDDILIELDTNDEFSNLYIKIPKEDLIKKISDNNSETDALLFILGYKNEIKIQDLFNNPYSYSLIDMDTFSEIITFSSLYVHQRIVFLSEESGFIHPDLTIKRLNGKIDKRVYYQDTPIRSMSDEQQYKISQKVFEYAIKRGFNMEYKEIESFKYLLFETANSPMSMNRLMKYKFESGITHNLPFYLSNEIVYGDDNQYENTNEERRETLRDVIYNKMHNTLHNLDKEIEGNVPIYNAFDKSTYLANYKFSVPNYKTNDMPKNTEREAPNKIRYKWKAITPRESVNNILEQVEGNRLLTAKEIEDVAMLISTHHEAQENARNCIREIAFKNELEEHGVEIDDNALTLAKEPHEVYESLLNSIDNKRLF